MIIDGDFVKADKTSLGADNGIAVAYCLAILDSDDIAHPPLEVFVTTDEETGMTGAANLNPEHLKGKTLINIDSEEEGHLLVSCAGGLRDKFYIPVIKEKYDKTNHTAFLLEIEGLKGGHSGLDIIKQRANANKLLGRILYEILNDFEIKLISIEGGSKDNAIPRYAKSEFIINNKFVDKLEDVVKKYNSIFKNEFRVQDKDINVKLTNIENENEESLNGEITNKVIYIINMIPHGINTMSKEIENLVESSNNLGVLKTNEENIEIYCTLRSSVDSLKSNIHNKLEVIAKSLKVKIVSEAPYPSWQYNPESKIREIFENVHEKMTGKKPSIDAIHAGLECGMFAEKLGNIDMISFGPNMFDVHSPDEKLSISSTERVWEYLLEVLKNIKY